jgi:transcriptional regulator with XRE-family HTH domain
MMLSHSITPARLSPVDVSALLGLARRRAGLSKRALARAAQTSPAAIVEYEKERRSPTVETLDRILTAAGARAVVSVRPLPRDPRDSARILADVLDLVDAIPKRPAARELRFPRLPAIDRDRPPRP